MKYALAFGLMSLALMWGSVQYPGARIPLAWTAVSFGWVALGYGGLGARVFGKRSDGKILLPFKLILLPYLLYTWAIWHLCRILGSEDASNRIDDNLVVGRRLLTRELLEGFDHFVDLTAEFEDPARIRSRPSYRNLPILDADIPSARELKKMIESVGQGRIYVHCAQGHGRTGLFALALLAHRGKIASLVEGMDLLKSLRPGIALNRRQLEFIGNYLKRDGRNESQLV